MTDPEPREVVLLLVARWAARLSRAMYVACVGAFALMTVLMVALGVYDIVDRHRPTYWGEFRSSGHKVCEVVKFSKTCESTGEWISQDGSMRVRGVQLDGPVLAPGETVRAAYRPGGLLGDDRNRMVHTGWTVNAGLWVPWPLAIAAAALGYGTWRRRLSAAAAARHRG